MISVKEIRLAEDEGFVLPCGSGRSDLRLTCHLSDRLQPGSLVIESEGKVLREIPGFVPLVLREPGARGGKFEGALKAIIEDGDEGFACLVGDQEIVRLDLASRNVDPVCRLNRRQTDDRGFYTLRLDLVSEGVLVIYEGGVVRIALNGKEMWHDKLAWDDLFERRDADYLYYSTEHGEFAPSGFKIDLETGKTLPR